MKLKKNIALSESGFVFNPSTGDSYSVNQLAGEILGNLKEAKPLETIKKDILNRYEVSSKALEEDISDFISYLHQLGLLDHGND